MNESDENVKKRRNRKKGKSIEETEEEIVFEEGIIPESTSRDNEIYKNKNFQLAALGAILILALILASVFN